MIKRYFILVLFAAAAFSCNNKTKKKPVSDMDVANAFVRDLLDNNFKDAEAFLLKDSVNLQLFESFRKQYSRQDKAVLEEYSKANILVNEASYVTDSVFIFNYSNSYKPQNKTILKLVRPAGTWLVDLKYTFSGNL